MYMIQSTLAWCQLKSISCVITGSRCTIFHAFCGFHIGIHVNDEIKQVQKRRQQHVQYMKCVIFFRITWLAMWYNQYSAQCIVIDVVKPQWRHAYCRAPNDGPKWRRHHSYRRDVIASFVMSWPNIVSWISELNLRRFELKMPQNAFISVMW
jgi:hypothetical protein